MSPVHLADLRYCSQQDAAGFVCVLLHRLQDIINTDLKNRKNGSCVTAMNISLPLNVTDLLHSKQNDQCFFFFTFGLWVTCLNACVITPNKVLRKCCEPVLHLIFLSSLNFKEKVKVKSNHLNFSNKKNSEKSFWYLIHKLP